MAITTFADETFPEKGTRGIVVSFFDEDDNPVTPNSGTIKWSLIKKPVHGETPVVVNDRENVVVTSASSVTIVLSGDDLQILPEEKNQELAERVLCIEWEYNSTLGNNLPEKAQYEFKIENLYKVT